MRTPRLTLVSEGNPRRRLLIGVKRGLFFNVFVTHDAPPFHETCKCSRQESNLVYELRGLACDPAHSENR